MKNMKFVKNKIRSNFLNVKDYCAYKRLVGEMEDFEPKVIRSFIYRTVYEA